MTTIQVTDVMGEALEEAHDNNQALIQQIVQGTQIFHFFRPIFNLFAHLDEVPSPNVILASLSQQYLIAPGWLRFALGDDFRLAAHGNADQLTHCRMMTMAQLNQHGVFNAELRFYQRGDSVLGIDIKIPEEHKESAELLDLSYQQHSLTLDGYGMELADGLEVGMVDGLQAAAMADTDLLVTSIRNALKMHNIKLCAAWSQMQSFRGNVECDNGQIGTIIFIASRMPRWAAINDKKCIMPGFFRLPFTGNGAYVESFDRPFWCPACTWRASEPHSVSTACREAQAAARRFNRRTNLAGILNLMDGPPPHQQMEEKQRRGTRPRKDEDGISFALWTTT
ncbi:hypothetical protein IE81DRAFT_340065 [Ceraceosorus guamensis]|uniref:Uncharacterized protein n=1 Tax=Ceraceosorus guamensis TaxID=1522189 RepID=A0A316W3F2_9BASI|nr:hypothetical protein IE81DRAFT_340065 [Ceraceosorus guamensis]PWN44406.1 hypothetical protein IE81DRAFT_340065 [Ceraceosorus guamensis]